MGVAAMVKHQKFENELLNVEGGMPSLGLYLKQNKDIFVMRAQGGVGDILNSRMIFEDLKNLTNMKITYAIPERYIPLVIDHPYLDEVIESDSVNVKDYLFRKDITNRCGLYENRVKPNVDKHRSDIWAEHIGLNLTNHKMHIGFYKEELKFANKVMKPYRRKMKIGIQPVSFHPSKNWEIEKWQKLIDQIKAKHKDCEIICFHDKPIALKNVVVMNNFDLREWMVVVNKCDYIITVATSMYCLANGLHKPTVAIFGCEDLDIYGKYFPEMIPIQRHRKHNDNGWGSCPCWNAWWTCTVNGRKFSPTDDKPPLCLQDITVDEVMKGFEQCLNQHE